MHRGPPRPRDSSALGMLLLLRDRARQQNKRDWANRHKLKEKK